MTDEILKRLDALAAKLGTTAQHLWAVLVREARIEAYEYVAWATLWLVLGAVAAYRFRCCFKSDDLGGPAIFCAIVATLFFLIACGCLAGLPGMLLNPEYWALQQVLKAASGK